MFVLFVLCLFVMCIFNNKDKIRIFIYLRSLWPKYLPFFFILHSVTPKGFVFKEGKLVWLYFSDNLQNSKTNMTENRDKIVNRDIS